MKKRAIFAALCLLCIGALLLCGCASQTGWVEKDDGVYYYLENGAPASGWMELDGIRYYFQNGRMSVGLQEIDGESYYFTEDGALGSGWTDGYYLRGNGTLVTGWLSLEGQRYYMTAEGAATGIREVDGSLYVFDQDGKLTSGWADLGQNMAYGDINCHPLTGWAEIDGRRYFFSDTGVLQTGWLEMDGFTYYFHEDGTPAQGITLVDGVTRQFASNGQLLILVNPWNSVPEGYTVELTEINSEHSIAGIAYGDYLEMMRDCENAGMRPIVCSSYRTQEYQERLYTHKVESVMEKEDCSEAEARVIAARSVAVPGTSEHQLGLALDIVDARNWNLDETQAEMPTQKWLMENSWRYGWILRYPNEKSEITGIIYEPWHYRYVGREIAAEIHELGVCLEEYLSMLTTGVG